MSRRWILGWAIGTVAIAAAFSLWFSSAGGSAVTAVAQITLHEPRGGFTLPKPATLKTPGQRGMTVPPSSPPNNPITLQFDGQVSCTSPGCTVLATLIAPFTNQPLATYAHILTPQQPLTLKIGLSQRAVNLLYQAGDPRCTVVVSVVNSGDGTPANDASAAATSLKAIGKTIPATIKIP